MPRGCSSVWPWPRCKSTGPAGSVKILGNNVFLVRSAPRGSGIGKRVQVAHEALQPLLDDVGVNLRRGNVRVAEQSLDDAQVGAVVQKVAREGVPQHVWADQPRR